MNSIFPYLLFRFSVILIFGVSYSENWSCICVLGNYSC
nr:MAG TPA: hypothetical protein [Caudoviricetes sp.]